MQKSFGIGTVSIDGSQCLPALHVDHSVIFLKDLAHVDHTAVLGAPSVLDLFSDWDRVVDLCAEAAEAVRAGRPPAALHHVGSLQIHAPHRPLQAFCTGANYHAHVVQLLTDRFAERMRDEENMTTEDIRERAEKMMKTRAEEGMPYIFSRIVSSYAGPFDDLMLPSHSAEPDWEAELGVVFKKAGYGVGEQHAMDYVAGYLVVNDVTSRDLIFTADPADLGADWLHAKHSPGFFPMGPWIVPAQFVPDPHNLEIQLKLNGKMMQDEKTSDMIFSIPRQIDVLSRYARFLPGDVLATGSPAGNGTHYGRYLQDGDVMEAQVEGLGAQRVRCVKAT